MAGTLKGFIKLVKRGKGSTLRIWKHLQESFPTFHISYDAVRNSVLRIEKNDNGTDNLISHMLTLKEKKESIHFSFKVEEEENILQSCTWSFSGSERVVYRCGDVNVGLHPQYDSI